MPESNNPTTASSDKQCMCMTISMKNELGAMKLQKHTFSFEKKYIFMKQRQTAEMEALGPITLGPKRSRMSLYLWMLQKEHEDVTWLSRSRSNRSR